MAITGGRLYRISLFRSGVLNGIYLRCRTVCLRGEVDEYLIDLSGVTDRDSLHQCLRDALPRRSGTVIIWMRCTIL